MIFKIIIRKKSKLFHSEVFNNYIGEKTFGNDSKNCNFFIDDDKAMAHHFTLTADNQSLTIIDNKTLYGTKLNGEKIHLPTMIKKNSLIEVGEIIIEVVFDTEQDSEKTIDGNINDSINKGEDVTVNISQLGDIEATEIIGEIKSYILLGIAGRYIGDKYLLQRSENKVGRDGQSNDILLDKPVKGNTDSSISRNHFNIVFKNGRYFIQDRMSKLRTWVNNTKLEIEDELELNENDEIGIYSPVQQIAFRFTIDNKPNISRPKFIGYWHAKYLSKVIAIFSIIFLLGTLTLSWNYYSEKHLLAKSDDNLGNVRTHEILTLNTESSNIKVIIDNFSPAEGDELILLSNTDIACWNLNTNKMLWKSNDIVLPNSPIWISDFNNDSYKDIFFVSQETKLQYIDGQKGDVIFNSYFTGEKFVDICSFSTTNNKYLYGISENGNLYNLKIDKNILASYGQFEKIDLKDNFIAGIKIGNIVDEDFKIHLVSDKNGELYTISNNNQVFKENIYNIFKSAHGYTKSMPLTFYTKPILYDFNLDGVNEMIFISREFEGIVYNQKLSAYYWKFMSSNKRAIKPKKEDMINPAIVTNKMGSDLLAINWYNQEMSIYDSQDIRNDQSEPVWRIKEKSLLPKSQLSLFDFNKDHITDIGFINHENRIAIYNGLTGKLLFRSDIFSDELTTGLIAGDISNSSKFSLLFASQKKIYEMEFNILYPTGLIGWNTTYGFNQNEQMATMLSKPRLLTPLLIVLSLTLFFGSGNIFLYKTRKKQFN